MTFFTQASITRIALFLGLAAFSSAAYADVDQDKAATLGERDPAAALLQAPVQDLSAMIDDNPDFADLDYGLPAGIDRRPAVLPAAAQAADADDAAFPTDDGD